MHAGQELNYHGGTASMYYVHHIYVARYDTVFVNLDLSK